MRWAASSTWSREGAAAFARHEGAVRQPQQPEGRRHASDLWGKVGVSLDGSAFDTDGYANVRSSPSAAASTRRSPCSSAKSRRRPTTTRTTACRRSSARGYFEEDDDNGKSPPSGRRRGIDDSTWKYVSGGVRLRLPDASTLQGTMFGDRKTFQQQLPRDSRCHRSARDRTPVVESDGADECGRRHGAVVTRVVRQARGQRRSRPALRDGDSIEDASTRFTATPGHCTALPAGHSGPLASSCQRVPPFANVTVTASARLTDGATTTRTTRRRPCPPARISDPRAR